MGPEPGMTGEHRAVVAATDTAVALGSGDVPVLATPRIIAWMEAAAVEAVRASLPEGHTTVGTHLTVDHVAPSPVGATIRAVAELKGVSGARLTFTVEAFESDKAIARGIHRRALVDRETFLAR